MPTLGLRINAGAMCLFLYKVSVLSFLFRSVISHILLCMYHHRAHFPRISLWLFKRPNIHTQNYTCANRAFLQMASVSATSSPAGSSLVPTSTPSPLLELSRTISSQCTKLQKLQDSRSTVDLHSENEHNHELDNARQELLRSAAALLRMAAGEEGHVYYYGRH